MGIAPSQYTLSLLLPALRPARASPHPCTPPHAHLPAPAHCRRKRHGILPLQRYHQPLYLPDTPPHPHGQRSPPFESPLDISTSRSLASGRQTWCSSVEAEFDTAFWRTPKLAPGVTIAIIYLSVEELGLNLSIPGVSTSAQGEGLSIVGGAVLAQLIEEFDLAGWTPPVRSYKPVDQRATSR